MNLSRYIKIIILSTMLISVIVCLEYCQEESEPPVTFTNPVVADGADPWVIQYQNFYYYCFSTGDRIWISRSRNLHEIGLAEQKLVWQPPKGNPWSEELWAPELHFLNNKWYIYVAADDGANENHRMYVLESDNINPQSQYTLKGKIADSSDCWAIDGTVLEYKDRLYFVWSGWAGNVNVQQNLYIAPMSNPWTISGNRVLISEPEYEWEKVGRPLVNEGPEILKKNDKIHIIYSASGSWTDDYCLGQLTFTGGDILSRESWSKNPRPVFSKTETVFGPGHASFVKSPDGREDWIVYHAAKYKGGGWDRDVRMQKFGWNSDDSPNFGAPVSAGVLLEVPSGSFKK
ncbi:MAG TPA: glycoside hydrolase family 43 protein [Candidatus Marinimicrobia bacterium]|nr:glycoside hydrolase family 43 protein [Candidatus Neomarinimicrobiota bacterium]